MNASAPNFICREFHREGDHVLCRLPDGSLKFLNGPMEMFRQDAAFAYFDSQEEAETAGIAATERHGLIHGMEV